MSGPPPNSALGGRPPDQVGILVADLDEAVRGYDALLGGGPWRCFEYGPGTVPVLRYRGGPAKYTVRIALNATAPQIELLEPGQGPSIYHEWLEQHPTAFTTSASSSPRWPTRAPP